MEYVPESRAAAGSPFRREVAVMWPDGDGNGVGLDWESESSFSDLVGIGFSESGM